MIQTPQVMKLRRLEEAGDSVYACGCHGQLAYVIPPQPAQRSIKSGDQRLKWKIHTRLRKQME